MKKKMLVIAVCVLLSVFAFIGGTTAYLFMKTQSIESTFQLGEITYKLRLDANPPSGYGVNDVSMPSFTAMQKIASGSASFSLSGVPKLTGYTFIGWAYDAAGTNPFTHSGNTLTIDYDDVNDYDNAADTVDIVLYAIWGVKYYSIKYHANGGEGTMDDHIIEYDKLTNLHKNAFSKADHTFGGWALSEDGEATYIDEQQIVKLQESGTLDLYAVWIQNSYKVTFDYQGGTGSPSEVAVKNGQLYVLPTYPDKKDYLFAGWYTEPNGGERVYNTTVVDTDGPITLYAHWVTAPANDVIQDLVKKSNPDDNDDGVIDALYLNFACASYFEKINIPLNDLVVGQTYKLSFTESNNATFGNNESGYGNAIYGCIITKDSTLDKGSIKAESIEDGGLIAQWSDRTKGNTWLNGPRDCEITFEAEATTMYWTWDYGLIQDGYKRDYNYTNITLVPVEPEIKFSNKQLIVAKNITQSNGNIFNSTARVKEDTSTAYTTNFVFDGDGYAETMYYPITGLTTGTTYTIKFDHTFDGVLIHDTYTYNGNSGYGNPGYDYGCIISKAAPTAYGSFLTNGDGGIVVKANRLSNSFIMYSAKDTNGNKIVKTESVTFTFTATDSTAYWVWNMANCSDSNDCTIDVKVTEFSAKHQAGGTITYYSAQSQTSTASYSTAPEETPEVTFIWDYIDDTNMDWYPADETYPIPGEDYELIFEPFDGYTMADVITVVIDNVFYDVYTSEEAAAGTENLYFGDVPAYDPETGILTIPGSLILDATVIEISAEAIEAEETGEEPGAETGEESGEENPAEPDDSIIIDIEDSTEITIGSTDPVDDSSISDPGTSGGSISIDEGEVIIS